VTTPFTDPTPKGQPPYWMRPRDLQIEREHMALIRSMEMRVRLVREKAKP